MRKFITILLLTVCSITSKGQGRSSIFDVSLYEMKGYLISIDLYGVYFLPCSDSTLDISEVIKDSRNVSFFVAHSLGCGTGINYDSYVEIGNESDIPFHYNKDNASALTVKYYYCKVWVDINISSAKIIDGGILSATIDGKSYPIGQLDYDDTELINVLPLEPHVYKDFIRILD